MKLDEITNQVYIVAYNEAKLQRHEYITPEHILAAVIFFDIGKRMIKMSGGNVKGIQTDLQHFFDEKIPKIKTGEPIESIGFNFLFESASMSAMNLGQKELKVVDLIAALFNQPESFAVYILNRNGVESSKLLSYIDKERGANFSVEDEYDIDDLDGMVGDEEDDPVEDISSFVTDMTQKASEGKYDPLIGREDVLLRTEQVLCRRTKNNPLHVGEPGVGKTAIAQGLAIKIAEGKAPNKLNGAKIFYLDMGASVAGTKYRGDFEERLKLILDTIASIENAIVYIDEIHTVVGAGSVSGSALDASNILKPYLSRGSIRFIGSTTYEEYRKFFEKDRALSRRFQKIEIDEPSISETISILQGLRDNYEKYHNVKYSDKILELAVTLSSKYIQDKHLPDKAIDVMDETGAKLRMEDKSDETITVLEEHIEETVALMGKVPKKSVSSDEIESIKNLGESIKKEVFGQDEAISNIVYAIKKSRSGLDDGEKPIVSLLFVGPTGVGKTEVAKQLADNLGIPLLRFDMSEYQEKHTVARLIGAPPGYVGFDEGGQLTEAVRKTPYAVLLLDEIEKAHSDILNVLLQIMDYAKLTDNNGKKADFRNIVLIMTSNAGAKEMGKYIIGFNGKEMDTDAIDKEVERIFSPEFRNRLDNIIIFNHLSIEMGRDIVYKSINKLREKLKLKSIDIDISEEAVGLIAKRAQTAKFGAREILRIVDKEVKPFFVDEVLFAKVGVVAKGNVVVEDDKIVVKFM